MERKNNTSYILHNFIRRGGAIALAMLLAAALIAPVNTVYAAKDTGKSKSESEETVTQPIREVHRVKIDGTRYCLFVTHNVVLTPAEIKKMSDEELITEIMSRAGLFMKESNCLKPSHKVITAKSWVKKGGSFSLSDQDIESIRGAAPSDGSPVKLHMDLGVSTDPYETEEDSKTDEDAGKTDEVTGTEDGKTDEVTGTEDGKTDESTGTEDGKTDEVTDTEDSKTDEGSGTEDGKTDEVTGTEDGKTEEVTGTEDGKTDEVTDTEDSKTDEDAGKKAEDSETGSDTAAKKSTRKIYSTSKLLSPELLFVVVATKSDAKAGEDICTIKIKEDVPPEPTDIDVPDAGDDEDTMLPEYRTIQMADRTGKPLEPTLQEGTPVSLKWIEPRKGIDTDNISEHIPAGLIGAIAALAIAIAATVVIIIRRRSSYEEYEDEE